MKRNDESLTLFLNIFLFHFNFNVKNKEKPDLFILWWWTRLSCFSTESLCVCSQSPCYCVALKLKLYQIVLLEMHTWGSECWGYHLSVCLQYHFSFVSSSSCRFKLEESDSCRRKTTPQFFSHELSLTSVELTFRRSLVIAAAVWRFSTTCVCETDRNIIAVICI